MDGGRIYEDGFNDTTRELWEWHYCIFYGLRREEKLIAHFFSTFKSNACDWLFPNQNATKLTSAQEINLHNLNGITDTGFLGQFDVPPFYVTCLLNNMQLPTSTINSIRLSSFLAKLHLPLLGSSRFVRCGCQIFRFKNSSLYENSIHGNESWKSIGRGTHNSCCKQLQIVEQKFVFDIFVFCQFRKKCVAFIRGRGTKLLATYMSFLTLVYVMKTWMNSTWNGMPSYPRIHRKLWYYFAAVIWIFISKLENFFFFASRRPFASFFMSKLHSKNVRSMSFCDDRFDAFLFFDFVYEKIIQ